MIEIIIGGILFALFIIYVQVAIARWIFRVNDIVDLLKATRDSADLANKYFERIDYFLEQQHKRNGGK